MLTQPAPASAASPLDISELEPKVGDTADSAGPPDALAGCADGMEGTRTAEATGLTEATAAEARSGDSAGVVIVLPTAAVGGSGPDSAAPVKGDAAPHSHREDAPAPPPAPASIADEPRRAGDRLRAAREAANLTLEHVSEKLRIRADYLAALEEMNLKLLPGKGYALPYLRSYAAFLKLDAPQLLKQFQDESALSREDATPQIRNPESKPERERPWIWALALALVAGGFVGYRALFGGASEQQGPGVQPEAPAAQAGVQRPVAPTVQGDGLPFGVAAQKVEIKALSQAWLEVRTPGGTVMLSQDLAAGQVYQPDTGAGWTLHARDGSAFEVFLNGVSVGVLGLAGQPVLGRPVDAIAAAAIKPTEAVKGPTVAPLPGPTARVSAPPPVSASAPTPPAAVLPPAPSISAVRPSSSTPSAAAQDTAAEPGVSTAAPRPAPRARPPAAARPKAPAIEAKTPVEAPPTPAQPDAWETGETPPPGSQPR